MRMFTRLSGLLFVGLLLTGVAVAWSFTDPTSPVFNYSTGLQMGNSSLNATEVVSDVFTTTSGDVLSNPEIDVSYIIYTDGSTVYAKNGTTGRIDYSGNATYTIQAAIDALTDGRTNIERVYISPSNYNYTITSPIYVPSYTHIIVDGYLKLADGANCCIFRNYDSVNGNSHIIISGHGTLDGNRANQNVGGQGIRFENVSYARVTGITAKSFYEGGSLYNRGIGIYFANGSNHIMIDHCFTTDNGHEGIGLRFNITDVIVSDCVCYDELIHGIQVVSFHGHLAENIAFVNNVISNTDQFAIAAHGEGGFIKNFIIANNVIRDTYGAIFISGTRDAVVANNVLKKVGRSICCEYGFNNIQFIGNVISEAWYWGIYLKSGSYCHVIGNYFHNVSQMNDNEWASITLSNHSETRYNIIKNNYIVETGTNRAKYGIFELGSDCHDNIVIDNYISGVRTAGVHLVGSGSKAMRNIGYTTENSGTATLTSGTTSVTVNHGLDVTPSDGDIIVTPTGSWGAMTEFWVGNYTSTQFTIHADQDPGQDVTFAWQATVR